MTPPRTGERLFAQGTVAAVCLALLAPALAHAEANVTVTADPNPVPEHESLQLKVQVESPLTTPVFEPKFEAPDFTVVGSGMYYSAEAGGGVAKKTTAFTFVLMPRRAGEFTVRNIEVKVGGQAVRAPDKKITVTAGAGGRPGTAPMPGSRPGIPPMPGMPPFPSLLDDDEEDRGNPAAPGYTGRSNPGVPHGARPTSNPSRYNSDFTVWASPSKTRAYVGEPVVVEYYLYDFGGLKQTEVLQWPTFTGFWKDDLELSTQVQFEDIFLNNQEMRRAFIARYALYGIKPGKISLDKLGIRGKYVANPLAGSGPFFGFDLRTGQHYSQDVSVEVLPLPEAGRPAKFTGAVGKFQLKLDADKRSLPQNSPVTFTLTLSGVGNFQAIDSIKLPLPPDFELYESTATGKGSTPIGVRRELESQKTFQVIAIPRKSGKFEVPALSWNYFNPEKEAYETLTTSPLEIEVTEATGGPGATNTYLGPKSDVPVAAGSGNDLRPLRSVTAATGRSLATTLGWAALALALLNLVLLIRWLLGRGRGMLKLVKSADPFGPARFALLRAKARDAEWQAELEEVVLMVTQALLDTNPRGLTKAELEDSWKGRGLPAPLFLRVSSLLEEIDRHRFSSQKLPGAGSHDLRSKLTREAESIIAEASKLPRLRTARR